MFSNLLQKLALKILKKSLKEGDILWRSLFSGKQSSVVPNPYEVSAWVFGAVNAIARNISRIPFIIYRNPKKDFEFSVFESQIVRSGKIFDIFKRPNFLTTWRQHIMGTSIFLELYGESFWILDRNNVSEIPEGMWLVNPTRFEPIWNDKKTKLIGWKYRNKGIEIDFGLDEIIFFKYPNPYDDLRGLAPLSPASLGVSQDYYASEFNKNFFEEGAAVSGIIQVEDELSPEAYTRLLAAFEERHKGYRKAHRVVLIEGGGKFTPVTPSYRDFEFTNLRRLNKEEIFTAFGVNPVILGDYRDIKCYHPDTMVLTDNGFVPIYNIKVGDKVASMDLSNGQVGFYEVTKTYSYDYKGDLLRPYNYSYTYGVDFMVTPEHKIVVRDKDDNLLLVPTDQMSSDFRYVKYGKFNSNNNNKFITIDDDNGYSFVVKIKDFMALLAWYLSSGNATKNGIKFVIKTPEGRLRFIYQCEKFKEYLEQTSQVSFVLTNKALTNHILKYIGEDKRIKRKLYSLPTEALYDFISYFITTENVEGEHTVAKVYTVDIPYAMDLLEVCTRCGIPASYQKVGTKTNSCLLKIRLIAPIDYYFEGFEKVPYNGKVYCLEVPPHHNICILFNGKVSWSGNSYEGINAAHRAFWIENIVPKAEMIADVINYQFLQYLDDGTYRFQFDFNSIEALREDFYRKVDSAERLYQIGFPINMINKRLNLGMDEVEWGDVWWVNQNKAPVDVYMENWNKLTGNSKSKSIKGKSKPSTEEDSDEEKGITPEKYFLIKKLDGVLRNFFFDQRKRVLNNIGKINSDYKKFSFGDILDLKDEHSNFSNRIGAVYKQYFTLLDVEKIDKEVSNLANVLLTNVLQQVEKIIDNHTNTRTIMMKIREFYNFVLVKCLEVSKAEVDRLIKYANFKKNFEGGITDEDS